jgi:Cu-Zn family superoxide dismutase
MKYAVLLGAAILIAGCAHQTEVAAPKNAIAILHSTQGNLVTGTVYFAQEGNKVKVTANVQGLKPGVHGFHIHEKGDCSAPDATSAGGHFNPAQHTHGGPSTQPHHAGDLGNLTADDKGDATYEALIEGITLSEGANGIIERGVIVHAGPDDFVTQPTGGSGARVACAVIKAK